MSLESKIAGLKNQLFTLLSETELEELLIRSEIVEEKDTLICGIIRILKQNQHFFIQEYSNQNEIILRSVNSPDQATQFIQERLKIYEKMWDGCGCRIEYFR